MKYITLEEVCENRTSNISQKDLKKNEGIYPIYGASGLIKKVDFYTQDKEYIGIVKDGAGVGRIMLLPSKSSVICTMQYIIPNGILDTKYLYYALISKNLSKYSSGATIPHIYFKDYKKEKIALISESEQKKVINILDRIIDIINKRKNQINLLEELVKSRFIEMFGDPIRNEKGWEQKFLEKISSFESKNITKYLKCNDLIWLLNLEDIEQNTGKIIKKKMITKFEIPTSIIAFDENYVLYSKLRPYLNKVVLPLEEGIGTSELIPILPRNEVNRIYLFNVLTSESVLKFLKMKVSGAKMPRIIMSDFKKLKISLPEIKLQNEFAEFVEKTNKLKFLYNLKLYIFINLLKKLTIEVLFFLTFLILSANIRLDIELAEREEKMKYYRRSIEQVINEYKEQFPILLLTGPRQVGKSTLFKELFQSEYKYFSLDDPILKEQLINDPRLFLKNNPEKLIIDEIQYAPSIFPYLKMKVDENREDGMYLMTGSQAFVLMKNVSETLAGRVGILELQGISLREQFNIEFNKPFIPNEEYISEREKNMTEYTDLWQRIHRGYMPELVFNDKKKWEFFYSSYVQTYIERDVRDLINISDESKFLKFMISLASRSGELLNYGAVANEVGVSNETVKRWVSVLRTSRIIYLMESYFNNHLKRVIKTPKIYFMDVGLLAYLTKWPTPETLANGAKAGNIFETFVVSEIIKSYLNAGIINPPVYFYRDKDKKEIDLIVEEAEKIYPIEIKMSASPDKEMAKNFSVLKGKIDKEIGTGIIICQYDNKVYLSEDILVLPIEYI